MKAILIKENSEFILSIRDYSIYIDNLPSDTTENEIFQHFNKSDNSTLSRVLNTTSTGNPKFLNSYIADITIVQSSNEKVKIIKTIKKTQNEVLYAKLQRDKTQLLAKIEQLKIDLKSLHHNVIGAFIIFQNSYSHRSSVFLNLFVKEEHKAKNNSFCIKLVNCIY